MRILRYLLIASFSCLFVAPARAEKVQFLIQGTLDGGGPGFIYPLSTSPHVNDDITPNFSFVLRYDTDQTADGTYVLEFGEFTIDLGTDYVGTLNNLFVDPITVTNGAKDTFELEMLASNSAGVVAAANFTGDEVFDKDGNGPSASNTGAAGPDDRYFRITLEDNTGTALPSNAIPTDLDLAWTKAEIQIRWQESTKISIKGTINSITSIPIVPEPSAIFLMGVGAIWFGCYCVATYRRRRAPQERAG